MSKPLPPSRTAPQFVVRFPDDELRDRIKRAAEANNRSMNAEIIARLQQSFVAETEFHGHSKLTHTPIEEDMLEEAAERGAKTALGKFAEIFELVRLLNPDAKHESLLPKMLEMYMGETTIGDKSKRSRTPTIPGQNAPKGGSKAPKRKGV